MKRTRATIRAIRRPDRVYKGQGTIGLLVRDVDPCQCG